MSPILGIWASQNYSRYQLPTSFESIATATAGAGGASSFTFSSIPSTYTHLQIRALVPNSNSSSDNNIAVRFNGSSSAVYTLHQLSGDGANAASGAVTGLTFGRIAHYSASSTYPIVMVTDILDYANANKYKTVRSLFGFDKNGAGVVALVSSLFTGSTNAITSIDIVSGNSVTFPQYSHFALYGIKGD